MFTQPENAHSKKEIRRALRLARKMQPENQRKRRELQANRQLKSHIKRGKRIAVYWGIGSELRLDHFIQAAKKRGAHVYLPYIEPHSLRLWFTPYPNGSLKPERKRGKSKLYVPQFQGKKLRADRLHMVVLPIVGIDKCGYRLGQGGGYYDFTFAACQHKLQPHKIAVGYACQSVASLPCEPHDIRAHKFVSERGIHRFSYRSDKG
ncbi:5-formyltetrahydrofolate cyclo-ligase [Kingella negevensis]|uniref:5-formyltetrahydrofolate cyclo-ligase n=1 Tax=Kingella negevensis TaxID=1522312 RepID=A0A238TDB5_9NEIS|nr:5-formyltetrahydrofolate cyclo-ligase [Kingella negevensis]MDK4698014.1 5-formyltetrahydrofolate cyclo-ligase [Kingella negevensis]MDK4707271.1 5-formyltetrahydrofolate cyclo-ligase [Kingella negevensis]MDK4710251.1 5-formyltetrahydrofolate cyclo-ligase [Kingella negevensis]WII92667.1 5-formyltetrahydrofolate cyclo-ligase [Kingella negevensis]SNB82023.1 5-formyltetrahydrofolate cyclo-ligase family protein [Kingella negevensis]